MILSLYGPWQNVGLLLGALVITLGSAVWLLILGDATIATTGLAVSARTEGSYFGISMSGCCIGQRQ